MNSISNLLSDRELLEIACVASGIKRIARFAFRSKQEIDFVSTASAKWGVAVSPQPLFTHVIRNDRDDNEYCILTNTRRHEKATQIVYFHKPRDRQAALSLFQLESGNGTFEEIGIFLGYPQCCCRAYDSVQRGRDWLENMLMNMASTATPFTACNRCARLFGDWAVLPDYFPCSFSCKKSMLMAKDVDIAGRRFGLSQYLDRAWDELQRLIRITPNSVERKVGLEFESLRRITNCVGVELAWQSC